MRALCTTLALLLLTGAVRAAELRTLAGKTVSGDLVSVSDKEIVVREGGKPVTVPVPDVLQINLRPGAPPPTGVKYTDIEVTDGTLLHCSRLAIKGKQAELTLISPDGAVKEPVRLQVPLAAVSYVLRDAQDAAVRQEWQEKFLAKKGNQDVLAIKKDDATQRLEGTFGAGDEKGEKIEFQLNAKPYQVDLARVHGMLFVRRPADDAPPPVCKLYDIYGNVLAVARLELGPNGFAVATVAGCRVEYPLPLVARLDYTKDKLAFLSDLEPVKVVEKSSFDRIDHYRRDKNLDDTPLRLAGKNYPKGLALHAYTELVYDLDGKYKKFKAVLGVDESVGGDGQTEVKIDGDGKELFSGVVARKDEPRPLALDVKGVKHLRIVARPTGLLNLGDHVDLVDAQVSK